MKKFIFSKLAGLQVYSQQLYWQMNSFTGFFQQHFKPPHAFPMYWLKPSPIKFWRPPPSPTLYMFSKPVGNLELLQKKFVKLPNLQKIPNLLFLLFNASEVLFSESVLAKLVTETCSDNSTLDYSGGSPFTFPLKTNLKLHHTPVTPKMIMKTISGLYFFKVCNSDCLSVEVPKNCNSEHL